MESTRYMPFMQVEAELQQLDKDEAQEYLDSLGVEGGGLKPLIRSTYQQLGLLTYFTTGRSPANVFVQNHLASPEHECIQIQCIDHT